MKTERSGSRSVLVAALQRFLQTEASSGILILVAAMAGLVWANTGAGSYERLWDTVLTAGRNDWSVALDLRHWINDGAMALFFFVVGIEIKRELIAGELSDRRSAMLPVAAALGGMIVPALVYLTVNAGGETKGWGIPVATDIAFAVGVLALVGRRLPPGLKLFLLTLAIVDDIGAILLIAIFYTASVSVAFLAIAVAILTGSVVLRRIGLRWWPVHLLLGVAAWVAVHESGIHATIAGVAVALITPVASTARLEEIIHPWTSYVIVPLFALANAGVRLAGGSLGDGTTLRVAAGVAVGLVLGKTIGITAGAAAAVRARVARLPDGIRWEHVAGVAALGGIGFTVSIFVAGLAFPEGALLDGAKVGILGGSSVAGVLGALLLLRASRGSAGSGARGG